MRYIFGRIYFLGGEISWFLLKYAVKKSVHCEINTSFILVKFKPTLGKFYFYNFKHCLAEDWVFIQLLLQNLTIGLEEQAYTEFIYWNEDKLK